MGRPKKSEQGPVPTRERILVRALELFAGKGYEAVSVRDITKSLGLNEASLYNHYPSKAALFDAILARLDERLIDPSFAPIPPEHFEGEGPFDLAAFLVEGARRFYEKTDDETILTWRMLMVNQYRYEVAYRTLHERILEAPVGFFHAALDQLQKADRIRPDVDRGAVARIIGCVFFDYSFRANLYHAWGDDSEDLFALLAPQFRFITAGLELG